MTTGFRPPAPRIVIVGGGLAGLAAASRLVNRGLHLTLLESRPRLGGRASSFTDPVTGELIDNCQHISMACCTNLADFCQRLDLAPLVRRRPEIVFLDRQRRVSRLRAGRLPAPFHLAGAFFKLRFLSLVDKLRIAGALAALRAPAAADDARDFATWLKAHGQSARAVEYFWAPILVSALNERLEQMDVGHARKVLLDGFMRNRHGFEPEIPLVPLGELYGARLQEWLARHQVDVRLTTGVEQVTFHEDGGVSGVVLRNGERLQADFVILAVPFDRVRSLIPEPVRERLPELDGISQLVSAPITGVHLWFDRPICPFDFVATPGRLVQWVFNHTAIQGRTIPGSTTVAGEYLQVVISASYDFLALDKAAIRERVLADLADLWPEVREARLVRDWVVTEHGATFAVRPGVDRHRPAQRTHEDGLFLAGDWTNTGWPATMEGAVRGGYLAAEGVLSDLDRPTRLVCPALPTGGLARWLLPDP